jgi:hypothetical protein
MDAINFSIIIQCSGSGILQEEGVKRLIGFSFFALIHEEMKTKG